MAWAGPGRPNLLSPLHRARGRVQRAVRVREKQLLGPLFSGECLAGPGRFRPSQHRSGFASFDMGAEQLVRSRHGSLTIASRLARIHIRGGPTAMAFCQA